MISNKQSKIIKSLQLKKYRKLHSSFFVEGKINVLEALASDFTVMTVFVTSEFVNLVRSNVCKDCEVFTVTEKELSAVGTYKSNNFGLAVLKIPDSQNTFDPDQWSIALDGVNDPGNLGTIIRTADWFGIKNIYCSESCVDVFNPKVLNSTKGSFSRVDVVYTDLSVFLEGKLTVTAEMDGDDMYQFDWPKGGVLVMGNESHGVCELLSKRANSKITIPSIGQAESLNVGVATAIICSDIRSKLRQELK